MSYEFTGHMTEICTCDAICPCFSAQDPDGGSCAFSWVFDVERGTIDGHDVAGLKMGFLGSFEGNALDGDVRLAVYVDDRASDEQQAALLAAFTGELGGPLGDLAGLVGEVVTVERAPIEIDVSDGTGHFRIGDVARGQMEGFTSPDGAPTTVANMALSPVLGNPGYPGTPVAHEVTAPQHGFAFRGNSSMQTRFDYVAV